MRHLTPDQILNIVEHTSLTETERAHLGSCAECRATAAQLTSALRIARQAEVPEPSPLFWDRFSDRVREEVAADQKETWRGTRAWRWPVLVPFTGLAVLVLALVSAVVPQDSGDEAAVTQIAWDGAPDSAWALLSDLVGPLDVETAQQAGIAASPGAAEEVVLLMTASEREELVRLLRQELEQPGG